MSSWTQQDYEAFRCFILFWIGVFAFGIVWQRFTIHADLTTPQWLIEIWPLYISYAALVGVYYYLKYKRAE